jgi:hypothetical protein
MFCKLLSAVIEVGGYFVSCFALDWRMSRVMPPDRASDGTCHIQKVCWSEFPWKHVILEFVGYST